MDAEQYPGRAVDSQGSPDLLDDTSAEERALREYRAWIKPEIDKSTRFIDDPDISATLERDRLNLVVSDMHTMFQGAAMPHTQCFCLG